MIRSKLLSYLVLASALTFLGCDHQRQAESQESAPAPASTAAIHEVTYPADTGPAPAIDGDRAMKYTKEIVKFGPRPLASANHKKVENYLDSHLKGDQVEDDMFTADTPVGKFPVHNIIAKYPGTKDGIVIIASHYDTNYPLRNTSYIGANDGASTSALLLEIANQLRGKILDGYSIWLVWDDAEEAMVPDTQMDFMADSLYGISHLADKWQADGTLKKVKAFILADMIGDSDLNVDRDQNSTPWLEDVVGEAAKRMGYQSHFFGRPNKVSDDHIPFMNKGVACADLIDFNYGYNNVFWHTTQDTVDKLSPKSLEIVGDVVLESVRILDKMEPLPPRSDERSGGSK
jgi:glutaminyl-peptide cyclotransferase